MQNFVGCYLWVDTKLLALRLNKAVKFLKVTGIENIDPKRNKIQQECNIMNDARQEGRKKEGERDVENGSHCPRECHTGGVVFEVVRGCQVLVSARNPRTALA